MRELSSFKNNTAISRLLRMSRFFCSAWVFRWFFNLRVCHFVLNEPTFSANLIKIYCLDLPFNSV